MNFILIIILKNMKKSFVLNLIILLIIGFYGCKETSDQPDTTGYIGTWTRTYQGQVLTINLKSDGTSTGTLGSTSLPSGTYTVKGSEFSEYDTKCPIPGRYNLSITGNVMTLTLISDACDGRYQLVPGVYDRKL
jgi:hypothetical protein